MVDGFVAMELLLAFVVVWCLCNASWAAAGEQPNDVVAYNTNTNNVVNNNNNNVKLSSYS